MRDVKTVSEEETLILGERSGRKTHFFFSFHHLASLSAKSNVNKSKDSLNLLLRFCFVWGGARNYAQRLRLYLPVFNTSSLWDL